MALILTQRQMCLLKIATFGLVMTQLQLKVDGMSSDTSTMFHHRILQFAIAYLVPHAVPLFGVLTRNSNYDFQRSVEV